MKIYIIKFNNSGAISHNTKAYATRDKAYAKLTELAEKIGAKLNTDNLFKRYGYGEYISYEIVELDLEE